MTAAESLGRLRLVDLILIATTCVTARSSGYREHRQLVTCTCMQVTESCCRSIHIQSSQFFRVSMGLIVGKRHMVAASPVVADNGEESRRGSRSSCQKQCARATSGRACECKHCFGHISGESAFHDQLLGNVSKFSCAVTMVGDAFQEQSGQSRERLRLSGTPAGYGGAVQPYSRMRRATLRSDKGCVSE